MFKNTIFGTLFATFLFACGGTSSVTENPRESVLAKVFKYDNSIQCESQGITLEDMQREIVGSGIEVKCAQKGHDGLSRTAVCGAGTGNINIYQITKADLSSAEALEYMRVETLGEYQDAECVQE